MGLVYQTFLHLSRAVAHCCFDFRVINRERIPKSGAFIIAMNHQSYLDPPLVGAACEQEIHFLARKSLQEIPVLGALLPKMNVIPYDQSGGDMSAVKTLIRLLRAGQATVIFPEGTRTPDGNLQPAQMGLGMVVAKTLVPVLPMRIFGAFDAFPRGASRLRLEPITIVVGEPLQFGTADCVGESKSAYKRISDSVMARIEALHCPPRRPVCDP